MKILLLHTIIGILCTAIANCGISEAIIFCQMNPREDEEYMREMRKASGMDDLLVPVTGYIYHLPLSALLNGVDPGVSLRFSKEIKKKNLEVGLRGVFTKVIGNRGYQFVLKEEKEGREWLLEEKLTKKKWRLSVNLRKNHSLRIILAELK